MLSFLAVALIMASCGVSAFLPTKHHRQSQSAAGTHHQSNNVQGIDFYSSHKQHGNALASLQMSYKSPDEGNSYNDDAFGLVFLTGGVLSQDIDFVATFASLSAIAAVGTSQGFFEKDERAPAAVALLTLVILPIISSLRQTGSLDSLVPPTHVEIGLCTVSAIWAFVNWSRGKEH